MNIRKLFTLLLITLAATANAADHRYIVEFKDHPAGMRALNGAGAEVLLSLPGHNAVAARIPKAALPALSKNPNILSIEDDPRRYPTSQTVPYGISMVQADRLVEGTDNGGVCIIDSGYYSEHVDLPSESNVTGSTLNLAWNADGCGHGTHVAGTVAAIGNNNEGVVGVNPSGDINLHIVRVFGDDCSWSYASDLVHALDECVNSGSRVVSMSLGGATKSRFEQRGFDQAYAAGILSIAAAGNDGNNRMSYPASYNSVISVAAVDSNKALADFSQYNSQVELAAPGVAVLSTVPWTSDNRLLVGADEYSANRIEFSGSTDETGITGALVDGGLCDSSGSWGGAIVLCERGSISFYDKVINAQAGGALAAVVYNNAAGNFLGTLGDGNSSDIPALSMSQEDGQILVAGSPHQTGTVIAMGPNPGSGYEAWDGTSMATPHVSGVAALVWSHFPNATNQEIRDALDMTALDLGSPGRDNQFGFGLVQAKAAYYFLDGGPPSCSITENPEVSCTDGQDNDCNGLIDATDPSCDIGGSCPLGQPGDICTVDADCCSSKCKGKPDAKTCN